MLRGMQGTLDGSFSPDVKGAVLVRARSCCERCGRWCGAGSWADFHHRIPRGMGGAGGERAALLSSPSNCLLLCGWCHRWVEAHRAESFEAGWLVTLGGDPAAVPVTVFDRGPVFLTPAGRYFRKSLMPEKRLRSGVMRVSWV